MQFKENGAKIEVWIYHGFDEKKGQPILKKIGSVDKYTYKPSPGLIDKLNPEQRDELQAECNRRRDAAVALNRQHYINSLATNLRGAADSLQRQAVLSEEQATEIWDAMDELIKTMRESGHARPTKKKTAFLHPGQTQLLE